MLIKCNSATVLLLTKYCRGDVTELILYDMPKSVLPYVTPKDTLYKSRTLYEFTVTFKTNISPPCVLDKTDVLMSEKRRHR